MQWTAATGWPGKKLRQPYTIAPVLPVTINYCCGNDAGETVISCRNNSASFPICADAPCMDAACNYLATKGCCGATNCFDSRPAPLGGETCVADGGTRSIDGILVICNAGVWEKSIVSCASGSDCTSGQVCIDTDNNGIINAANQGECGTCDGTHGEICGTIAHGDPTLSGTNSWHVCNGASPYKCYDQTVNFAAVPADLPCYSFPSPSDMSETSSSAGGRMPVSADQTRNYVRCAGGSVCRGTTALPWIGAGNAIGGGACASIDASGSSVALTDLSDASPNTLAITHILRISTTASHLNTPNTPNWKFLFSCLINPGIPYGAITRRACDQAGNNPLDNSQYMWGIEGLVGPGISTHADYLFEPRCNQSYIGARAVSGINTYTTWGTSGGWITSVTGNPPGGNFNVVSCETDQDARAVANFNTSNNCNGALGQACDNSYCSATQHSIACPTDLDNTNQCRASDNIGCCAKAGSFWLKEGEDGAVGFGSYGDGAGNIMYYPNPDTGTINGVEVAECCGDDANENSGHTEAYDNPMAFAGDLCCSSPNQCLALGKCNDRSSNNGHEACNYLGDCTGVNTAGGSSCFDSVDNDCDDTTDFCDGTKIVCTINGGFPGDRRDDDCVATITGAVTDSTSGLPINGANVKAIQRGSLIYSGNTYSSLEWTAQTNAAGQYTLRVNAGLSYDIIASAVDYDFMQTLNVPAGFREPITRNFVLDPAMTSECKDDCTTIGSPLCNPACDNRNGCLFHDAITRNLCDGKQPGFRASYSLSEDVICCEGAPFEKESIRKVENKLSTNKKNLVRITKPLVLDGQQVNMVIDIFS